MNFKTLPAGYRIAGIMDFTRNRRQMLVVSVSALAAAVIMIVCGLLVHPIVPAFRVMVDRWYLWPALAAMLAAYVPLHELTHGAFMYALSGVRPVYGLKLPYAYAGSSAFFDRKSHIVTALAPVVIWGIILQGLCAALPEYWFWPIWAVQISNVSGSTGDIYCVLHLARLPGEILIRDTGTRMTIYKKRKPSPEELKP